MMPASQIETLIAQQPAFRPIQPHLQAMVARNLQLVQVSKRQPFLLSYPPATHYLLPLTRALTLHREGDVLFGMRLPQGILWPVSLKPHETMQVCTVSEGQLGILSAEAIAQMMQISAETRYAILQCLCQSQVYVAEQLEQYACNDLSGRVARLLLELDEQDGGTVGYAHSQLAALLNAQRESVSVIIGRFRRAGWVSTSYASVRIIDRPALNRLASQY